MSPDCIIVWKDGKSAETSHENLPDVDGDTLVSTNWLSFDDDCWKERKGRWIKRNLFGAVNKFMAELSGIKLSQ